MLETEHGAETEVGIVLGVDTHLDVHVAAALDLLGRRLDAVSVSADARGYEALVGWAEELGPVVCAGVEGTSSYGAGLVRYLNRVGMKVVEVERPKPRHLRRNNKSDPKDAEAAARAVLGRPVVHARPAALGFRRFGRQE